MVLDTSAWYVIVVIVINVIVIIPEMTVLETSVVV